MARESHQTTNGRTEIVECGQTRLTRSDEWSCGVDMQPPYHLNAAHTKGKVFLRSGRRRSGEEQQQNQR